MELTHTFDVSTEAARVWDALLDLQRVASCMPGARLEGQDGDDHVGTVRIKLGPVSVGYRGRARFTEIDDAQRRAVLEAEGRDMRGQGAARAVVTVTVSDRDGGSRVMVTTHLDLTGKVAQFGRGAIEEVSSRLLDDFAHRLQESLAEPSLASVGAHGSDPSPAAPSPGAVDSLDLTSLLPAGATGVLALAGGLVALVVGVALARRRSASRDPRIVVHIYTDGARQPDPPHQQGAP